VVQVSRAKKKTSEPRSVEPRSVVDEVTDKIAFDIASGVLHPGDRLPSVRALAMQHGINPSTVQIVLSRLRATGFVDANPRSGFVVRDIELYGGIDTWRYLFRFAQRIPERATKLFENFLATRRVLVLEVARSVVKERGVDLRSLRRAVERFEALVASGVARPEDFARAEQQAARVFMREADQPVLLALYNTVGDILLTVPAVLEAMYTDPTLNVKMWRGLIERWESGARDDREIELANKTLAGFHVMCVERYRAILKKR
jgi:GntR family transcriptional regulator, transcriptional repressor for pyruvate dehydrogenase complex